MKTTTSGAGGRKYNQEQSKAQLLDTRADKIKDKVNMHKQLKIHLKKLRWCLDLSEQLPS